MYPKIYILVVLMILLLGRIALANPISPIVYNSTPKEHFLDWGDINLTIKSNDPTNHPTYKTAKNAKLPFPNLAPGITTTDSSGNIWMVLGGGGFANIDFSPQGFIGVVSSLEPNKIYIYPLKLPDGVPNGIYIDTTSNQAYVTQYLGNRLSWFSVPNKIGQPIKIYEVHSPIESSRPTGVWGVNGVGWFNLNKGHSVVRWDTLVNDLVVYKIPTDKARPTGLIGDRDGNIWFSEMYGNKVGRINKKGQFAEFHLPSPRSKPSSLSVRKDGSVWFSQRGANKLGVISKSKYRDVTFSEDYTGPFFTTIDYDENIWVTQLYVGGVAEFNPSNGRFIEYLFGKGEDWPGSISITPNKEVWVTNLKGNSITRLLD